MYIPVVRADTNREIMAVNSGGYRHCMFVDKNLDKYTCNICTSVLKDPHLTGCCGQIFCESCLEKWFTKHGRESCPHCRAEGIKDFQHLLDKRLKREIDSLRIHCTNKKEGCQWIGELGSLKEHIESANGCGYVEVECPNKCRSTSQSVGGFFFGTAKSQDEVKKMKRRKIDNHLRNECPNRPYHCQHCGHKDTYQSITGGGGSVLISHYNTCPDFPLKCPNKCGRNYIKRKDMEDHRSQCPEVEVMCPNKCLRIHGRLIRTAIRTRTQRPTQRVPMCNKFTTVKRKDLDRHLADVCALRPYQCEHCGKKDTYKTITTEHYNKCPEYTLLCPNKCDIYNIKRKDMEDHRSQCPEEPVQCPFKEAGCKEKLVRHELEQHMSATQQQHLLMVMGAYKEAKKELAEHKEKIAALTAKVQELETK